MGVITPPAKVQSGINDTVLEKDLLRGQKGRRRQSMNCRAWHSEAGLETTSLARDLRVGQNTNAEHMG